MITKLMKAIGSILPMLTVVGIALVMLACLPFSTAGASAQNDMTLHTYDANTTWIVKWKDDQVDARDLLVDTIILSQIPKMNVMVVQPREGVEIEAWLAKWQQSDLVAYVTENQKIHASAIPNDPLYKHQTYLKQIGMEKIWDVLPPGEVTRKIKIALIDTGIDLTHPELKDRIVAGVNLIEPGKPPQDDNGHGTKLAGVIAAVGNNNAGVAGILPHASIMPVKVLGADGSGDEAMLGQGIRYAVDHGAKIIDLSLGLFKYSPFLEEVTRYAEERGVLLVAASGNKGQNVKYPAAFPTVLAVGGVDGKNNVLNNSNYGPELDIVAPFSVFTTALGGDYDSDEGTSMATPQVAAVAALIWSKYPEMKPYQIRDHLRHTAQDIHIPGWDPRSGYGLLRADLALSMEPIADIHEPNDQVDAASPMPVDVTMNATLSSTKDVDWFKTDIPYNGSLTIQLKTKDPQAITNLQVEAYKEGKLTNTFNNVTQAFTMPVQKGTLHFRILTNKPIQKPIHYHINNVFTIYADSFENNDKQYLAFTLPPRSQTITGTFNKINDVDWYMLNLPNEGALQVIVSPDTSRMDTEIFIERLGGNAKMSKVYDYGGDGAADFTDKFDVEPGIYYIRIRNLNYESDSYPVRGEYTLDITYSQKFSDPNEPNNRMYEATTMAMDTVYKGLFATANDEDWFTFTLDQSSFVHFDMSNIPDTRTITMKLFDKQQQQLAVFFNDTGEQKIHHGKTLDAGTYYVKLNVSDSIVFQLYHLKISADPLSDGFRDIKGHWAADAIINLYNRGIVAGYENKQFRPDGTLTRAEATMILVNAVNPPKTTELPSYTDIDNGHWAYMAVTRATRSGLLHGYPDNTFRPDQPVTRMEMAVMVANALGLEGMPGTRSPFQDIPANGWGVDLLRQLVAEDWITGFPDQTFRGKETATRAQFVSLIDIMVMNQQ